MIKQYLLLAVLMTLVTHAQAQSPVTGARKIFPAPAVNSSCQLGNHGALRGRPTVVSGALLADHGCLLRAMAFSGFGCCYHGGDYGATVGY